MSLTPEETKILLGRVQDAIKMQLDTQRQAWETYKKASDLLGLLRAIALALGEKVEEIDESED